MMAQSWILIDLSREKAHAWIELLLCSVSVSKWCNQMILGILPKVTLDGGTSIR